MKLVKCKPSIPQTQKTSSDSEEVMTADLRIGNKKLNIFTAGTYSQRTQKAMNGSA
jgi:hypothetical protein